MFCSSRPLEEKMHAIRKTMVQPTDGASCQARFWPTSSAESPEVDENNNNRVVKIECISTMGAANLRESADKVATHMMPSLPAVQAMDPNGRR